MRPAPSRRGAPQLLPPPSARWRQALGVEEPGAGAPAPESNGRAAAAPPGANGHAPQPAGGDGGARTARVAAPPEPASSGGTPIEPPPGLLNDQFAAALQAALARTGDQLVAGPREERQSPLRPIEEMLLTALNASRGNVRRLLDRQAALEAEIAAEQKQAERIHWVLSRVRSDYAYFGALDSVMNSDDE